MNKSTAVATQLRFADLERVGPNTPSGRYLRLFWQPVAQRKISGPRKPSLSKFSAKNSRCTAVSPASRT